MILTEPIYEEVKATVISTLGLSGNVLVTKATKFIRFDWRSLIQHFQSSGVDLQPPYVIIRASPSEPAEWGMADASISIPIEIFLIDDEANKLVTTTLGNTASATQTFASTARMFVGQRLWFLTTQVSRVVMSITNGTTAVLSSTITPTTGETVVSEMTSDVDIKIDLLRHAFLPGTSFTTFQIVEDPSVDVTDMNPVNEYQEKNDYQMFAGSMSFKALVGEILV